MMPIDLKLGYTDLIISTCEKYGVSLDHAAYILATAFWETARTMEPVKEAYWLSESWRKNNLRYYPWYGRGFVQLTWEANYKKASKELSVDLLTNPDKALDPNISSEILVKGMLEGWFTGKKLSDYNSYVSMRAIINGSDKAKEIADIALQYKTALAEYGYGKPKEPKSYGFLSALIEMLFRKKL